MERPHISAYLEDGPHGGETLMISPEPDGSPPSEITLQNPPLLLPHFEEPSLRHALQTATSTYRLVAQHARDGNRHVYRLARPGEPAPAAGREDAPV
jgi:hypothetical protein